MGDVRNLKTRTETYWRDEYQVSRDDLDLVTGLILEASKPQPLATLLSAIIMRRSQKEADAIARQAASGQIYQPMGVYKPGTQLFFTALDLAAGQVVAVRSGRNPKYEPFEVVKVAFEDGSEREFAANFSYPHVLNRPAEELLGGDGPEVSEAELVMRFEHYVARALEPRLSTSEEFVTFDGQWFLRELLPDVHVGYLNLAEAMIYEARHALSAGEMLEDLGLETTASRDAQMFAFNHVLGQDKRFDNIGSSAVPLWYLRALEPAALHDRPAAMQPAFRAVGGEYIGITMLDLVESVGDELDDIETLVLSGADTVSIKLIFPHRQMGTLPLTAALLKGLDVETEKHFPLSLVDVRNKRNLGVWGVPAQHYIAGLGEWYDSLEMPVGAQLTLRHGDSPQTWVIEYTPARGARSEWSRSASVEDGKLVLQMQRALIPVKADRSLLVDVPNPKELLRLMEAQNDRQVSLQALVRRAFEELAKLSSRGLVHALSVYSVVNLLRRSGTVPVFAEITRRACYDPMGDGLWAYDPSVGDDVYRTSDQLRERPMSTRADLVKDQVVQYLGR